jgi:hypothetical protein
MGGYSVNIETKTLENTNFRQVLFTAPHSQLVVMTLQVHDLFTTGAPGRHHQSHQTGRSGIRAQAP